MSVRYEGDSGEPDLEVVDWVNTSPDPEHGKFSTLYEWHQQDPPDAFEINRNNVIYSYQNNRNPFIDHPEYLINIYDPTNAVEDFYLKSFNIYPNPAKDNISVKSANTKGFLSIRNILGQEVYNIISTGSDSEINIDVSGLSKGLYILTFSQDNHIFTEKILIE